LKRFIPRDSDDFDDTIIFNGIAGYDFIRCEDEAYLEYVDNAIFNDALGKEVGGYLKQKFAFAFAGRRSKEASVIFGIGSANAGKSLLGKAIGKCGGDYIGYFNGNNLQLKKNNNGDDAQSLRWLSLLKDKRGILSQEMGMEHDINGEIIKKMSGGDPIIGRGHGGNETSFEFNAFTMAGCNDAKTITPFDDAVKTRVRVVPYDIAFTDNPEGEFEKAIDYTLNDAVKTDKFAKALMTLLQDSYFAPYIKDDIEVTIKSAKEQFQSETGGVMDTILSQYELTGDPDDYVRSKEINHLFEGKSISSSKVGREISKYCKTRKIDGVKSKSKKLGGKSAQVWSGVRERREEDSDSDEN